MRKIMKAACALTAAVFCACVPAFASGISEGITMHKSASYSSGEYNVDGGVMEIIAYNKSNQKAYAVNGQSGVLAVIDLSAMEGNGSDIELSAENIDIRSLVGEMDSSFSYGDMTSVAVSPDGSLVALALQDASFDEDGRAAIFSCNEDGSLTFKALVRTGVQPDMITFADDNTILTADEGEPREGYGEGIADPAGSVNSKVVFDRKLMQSPSLTLEVRLLMAYPASGLRTIQSMKSILTRRMMPITPERMIPSEEYVCLMALRLSLPTEQHIS